MDHKIRSKVGKNLLIKVLKNNKSKMKTFYDIELVTIQLIFSLTTYLKVIDDSAADNRFKDDLILLLSNLKQFGFYDGIPRSYSTEVDFLSKAIHGCICTLRTSCHQLVTEVAEEKETADQIISILDHFNNSNNQFMIDFMQTPSDGSPRSIDSGEG